MLPRLLSGALALGLITALTACTAPPAPDPAPTTASTPTVQASASAADQWIAYYDGLAADLTGQASSMEWGSFGAEGAVNTMRSSDDSLAPGEHFVMTQCTGPQVVTVTLIPGDDGTAPDDEIVTKDIPCPGGAVLAITTKVQGLTVELDSHGKPGAFLRATDVES
jgi:hypothetical protein